MLKKTFKLNSKEIKGFFNNFQNFKSKTIRNDYFDLKFISEKEKSDQKSKFAIIISSKTFKKAVIRNKVRRQLYSIIENYLRDNNLENKINGVLFYPKKEILKIKFLELKLLVYNDLNNNLK